MRMSRNKIVEQDEIQKRISLFKSYYEFKSKPFSGDNETQLAEGGEADLHKCFTDCEKNPDHKNFIPFSTLSKELMPGEFRTDFLYDLVKASGDLTVRIGVDLVSMKRPQFWPTVPEPYPFYDLRGKKTSRYGTGTINGVIKFKQGESDENNYETCPCRKCQQVASPSTVWWQINVQTAGHVVFDDSEAKRASCRLFFDGPDSPLVIIDAVGVKSIDTERDWCTVKCVTCDPALGKKVDDMWERCIDLWTKVPEEIQKRRDEDRLTFIVSHPHGCHKHVSFGQWTDKFFVCQQDIYDIYRFNYTTDTCAGSSGAFVFNLGYTWGVHIHSGTKNGLNYSCIGLERPREVNEAYTKMASLDLNKYISKINMCKSQSIMSLDLMSYKPKKCLSHNPIRNTVKSYVYFTLQNIPNSSSLMYSIDKYWLKMDDKREGEYDASDTAGHIQCFVTSESHFIDN